MNKIYVGMGSNMGDKRQNISTAIKRIGALVGEVISVSSLYETEPWGFESDDNFLNMVIGVETVLGPPELLGVLMLIEESLGRERRESGQYLSRPIDLDILFFNDLVYSDSNLTIPHPHLTERLFVLLPLAEVCGDLVHPVIGKSMGEIIEQCKDSCGVKRIDSL